MSVSIIFPIFFARCHVKQKIGLRQSKCVFGELIENNNIDLFFILKCFEYIYDVLKPQFPINKDETLHTHECQISIPGFQ